jgi:hypothetical protein
MGLDLGDPIEVHPVLPVSEPQQVDVPLTGEAR